MKVLVIGGTRFIGAHLVTRLAAAGSNITVFHRGQSSNPILPNVRHVRHSAAEYPITFFPLEIASENWDIVVHMVLMGEADARSAVETFTGKTGRFVMVSSSDVYRAYGRLTRSEPGAPDPIPLGENAPLRESRYPYRGQEDQLGAFARDYEKILAERIVVGQDTLPWTILRLPKVYGREDNGDLATVYGFARAPEWRWTHGAVENVAVAIECAAKHAGGERGIFNVGEERTPTMAERLSNLPTSPEEPPALPPFDFTQDFVLDTRRLRNDLGFRDVVDEAEAMRSLARAQAS